MDTRINFNGKMISRTMVKNRIMKVWNVTTDSDRTDWYRMAHTFALGLAEKSGLSIIQCCGIISALSPLMPWDRNMQLAERVILDNVNADELPCLKLSAKKAVGIRTEVNPTSQDIESILNGKKTRAFFLNILNPADASHVTIDRHAISIAIGNRLFGDDIGVTPKQYDFFRDCYIMTAREIGISPVLLQSATWVRWREMKKG